MPKPKNELAIIPVERIAGMIFMIREQKVMLDRDLAGLYGVKTKIFNQAVKRNIERFPEDFMFQLSQKELANLRSQIVTSSWGGQRYRPYVFTEQGVAMLSSILNSQRAIQVNIQIMRTFTKLRELLATNELLRRKIEALERKYDQRFKVVFDVIKRLIEYDERPKKQIGFRTEYKLRNKSRVTALADLTRIAKPLGGNIARRVDKLVYALH